MIEDVHSDSQAENLKWSVQTAMCLSGLKGFHVS